MYNIGDTIVMPHLLSPISALSAKSKHYIKFQCIRNTTNKSIEFPDSQSYFFRLYNKIQHLVIV